MRRTDFLPGGEEKDDEVIKRGTFSESDDSGAECTSQPPMNLGFSLLEFLRDSWILIMGDLIIVSPKKASKYLIGYAIMQRSYKHPTSCRRTRVKNAN